MGIGYSCAGQILMVHESIKYTRRRDLEVKYISAIIIDIKLANKRTTTMVALYRQWNLPRGVCNDENKRHIFRYKNILGMLSKILELGRDVIIVGGDNIDTYKNDNLQNIYSNFELKKLRDEFLVEKI